MAGLYFHIPFCRQACNYCDFHFSTLLNDKERVLKAMILELNNRKNYINTDELNSIYFGGGTPSVLEAQELEILMKAALSNFQPVLNAEITLELNPDDVNKETLAAWKNTGINRLSVGLQSFNSQELKWMKRKHTREDSIKAIKMAQKSGFDNISVDLIYGSKFQDSETWEETLDEVINLNIPHISAYNLTIEKKTELGVKNSKGLEPGIDEKLSVAQFLLMRKKLMNAGFMHYEISNFAKPGFEAKHNSSYWKQQTYLGIGPSAHSFDHKSRQWNFANNSRYCKAIEAKEIHYEMEILSANEKYNEYVLTGLRTAIGCDLNLIAKEFGSVAKSHFEKQAENKNTFLNVNSGNYTLNEQGMLRADAIASDLFLL